MSRASLLKLSDELKDNLELQQTKMRNSTDVVTQVNISLITFIKVVKFLHVYGICWYVRVHMHTYTVLGCYMYTCMHAYTVLGFYMYTCMHAYTVLGCYMYTCMHVQYWSVTCSHACMYSIGVLHVHMHSCTALECYIYLFLFDVVGCCYTLLP